MISSKKIILKLSLVLSIITILMVLMMESTIMMYLSDIYNPAYYIYQGLLYALSVLLVIKNVNLFSFDNSLKYAILFSLMCFLFSLIRLNNLEIRNFISVFFNTCIIPFALLNGRWLGENLKCVKNRDIFLLLLQIPALYSINFLLTYNSTGLWFGPDAAFCIVVFFPLVFCLKRDYLILILSIVYILFILTAAKRSLLVLVFFCFFVYLIYFFKFKPNIYKYERLMSGFLFFCAFLLLYFINQDSGTLSHALDRIEELGGMTGDNGRNEIYTYIFNSILNSDLLYIFFGHGFSSVKNDIGVGAHNDLLEIIYDYGIVALYMYVMMLLCFFKLIIVELREVQYRSAMMLGISLLSIIVLGMLNCIVSSTILLFVIFFSFGCAIGIGRIDDESNNVVI